MARPAIQRIGIKNDILWQVLAFCRLLKRLGVNVAMNRVIDAVRSLTFIDLSNKQDFYYALRTNLISSHEEIPIFDAAFDLFWRKPDDPEETPDCCEETPDAGAAGSGGTEQLEQRVMQVFIEEFADENEADDDAQEQAVASYSAQEVLATKDFSAFDDCDVRELRQLLARLAPKMATKLSRRTKAEVTGHEIDRRRALRANIKYGGRIIELPRRRRKITKTKLVLLCDVSGSMDCYSKFLIQFIYAFQSQIKGVETFVFSTRLTRITNLLHTRDIYDALSRLSQNVLDWSGGTAIGTSLREFNEGVGKSLLGSKTIVVIISDGWDRGDCDVLAAEMRRLRSRSYKIIWLNPLAGSPTYQPICSGMKSAMPYVDYFLPAHNLNALMILSKVLRSLAKK